MASPPRACDPPAESAALTRVLDRAELGKIPEPELIKVLRQHPRMWRYWGDLEIQARASFARALGGKGGSALKISAEWKAKEIYDGIAGPDPSPLERLLASRIATCWLELYALDMTIAQEVKPGVGRLLPAGIEAADKRRGRAHKRFLAAVHELALVRRLLVPPVRVHIDQRRQVPAEVVAPALPALPPRREGP